MHGDDGVAVGLQLLVGWCVCVEVFASGVRVEREAEEPDGEQRESVHRDEDTFAVRVVDGFCDELGRERQEGNDEQQQQVDAQQQGVGSCQSVGHRAV